MHARCRFGSSEECVKPGPSTSPASGRAFAGQKQPVYFKYRENRIRNFDSLGKSNRNLEPTPLWGRGAGASAEDCSARQLGHGVVNRIPPLSLSHRKTTVKITGKCGLSWPVSRRRYTDAVYISSNKIVACASITHADRGSAEIPVWAGFICCRRKASNNLTRWRRRGGACACASPGL